MKKSDPEVKKSDPQVKKAGSEVKKPRPTYHLIKSEPESRLQNGHEMKFSIDDLFAEPNATAHWDGVRNYEARNNMLQMRVGDLAFFYHSNTKASKPGIVGIVEVVRDPYPDHTAWDEKDPHYDPKSNRDDPRWHMVDVRLVRRFSGIVTLESIKEDPKLAEMQLVKRGRISVQPVRKEEWMAILAMAEAMEQ